MRGARRCDRRHLSLQLETQRSLKMTAALMAVLERKVILTQHKEVEEIARMRRFQ
jgi:hypothetical protein